MNQALCASTYHKSAINPHGNPNFWLIKLPLSRGPPASPCGPQVACWQARWAWEDTGGEPWWVEKASHGGHCRRVPSGNLTVTNWKIIIFHGKFHYFYGDLNHSYVNVCQSVLGFDWKFSDQSSSGWWFGTFGLFLHRLGIMIPPDFHIQRGWNHQPIIVPIMAMKMPTTYDAEEAEGGGAPIQPQHMLNWSCGCDRHHVRNHLAMASTHASCWVAFTAPFKAALHNNLLPLKGLPGHLFFCLG